MATTNPTITGGWNLIVPAGDEFLLTLPQAAQTVFVATGSDDDSDTDTDPQPPAAGILGHALAAGQDGMSRALLGPGPVFARCVDSSASVVLALNVWTPAE
ncbi:MAG TPA: hypothetical protein PLY96_15145 [Chromatiaceae bacterium]|nr:hypothetical protein [Chromatiaceae bacterium]